MISIYWCCLVINILCKTSLCTSHVEQAPTSVMFFLNFMEVRNFYCPLPNSFSWKWGSMNEMAHHHTTAHLTMKFYSIQFNSNLRVPINAVGAILFGLWITQHTFSEVPKRDFSNIWMHIMLCSHHHFLINTLSVGECHQPQPETRSTQNIWVACNWLCITHYVLDCTDSATSMICPPSIA